MIQSWDIFCRVVDNYGDIGVCWRLARQLAAERDDAVRLWVDAPQALAMIWPAFDAGADAQRCEGVEIRHWSESMPDVAPHAVVIEAFACKTPDSFVEAMVRCQPAPVWINLEYLSAEAWIDECHLLPSPHPQLPLTKYFYFPGFTPDSGGLLRERGLLAARDAFMRDAAARADFWRALDVVAPPDALRISMFAYANPAAMGLLEAWAGGAHPIVCVVPEGVLSAALAAFFGAPVVPGARLVRGNLQVAVIPFVQQTDYDLLLWASDINFVRGEDSFVRAQWAGVPLVWHIYPQEAAAHRHKLDAFVRRHRALLGTAGAAVGALFDAWNGEGDVGSAWAGAHAALPQWRSGAAAWSAALANERDLVSALSEAVENRL
ncbi:MAG: elongation factor P maturation arginine rhamnosyltransferase EarP [Betaproteobacteria bacterium]